jgi:hypothetical protein
MQNKCDLKMEQYACMITAPETGDILPGRMLRRIVENLEKQFQLFEFSCVQGYRTVDEMEDVIGVVELQCGFFKRLMGKQDICVFQKLHPSFYDEGYVQLSEEEKEEFAKNLPEGDEFHEADYTVSIPPFFFVVATQDDSRKLMDVLNHLKLLDFAEARDAVATLCDASISIFDEIELLVEYSDEELPNMLTDGLEEWLNPPETVEYLDI